MSSTDVVKAMYEAFGKGDIDRVLGLMDSEVRWHEAESSPYDSGDGWIGPDAVLENLFAKMGEDWEEFEVHPDSFHEADSVVTMEGRYSAKHRGTGKSMDCQVCHIWTVRDGKIAKFQQYVDTAKIRKVMGVSA